MRLFTSAADSVPTPASFTGSPRTRCATYAVVRWTNRRLAVKGASSGSPGRRGSRTENQRGSLVGEALADAKRRHAGRGPRRNR
jgi:hypothetical protein